MSAPPPAAAPAPSPPVDLVTSLQEALGRLNAMLFNYVGALQRDAPPASLKAEPLVAAPKTYDVQAQTELMSKDMLAGLKEIEQLIQLLPDSYSSEADDVAAAVALLHENAAAAEELQAELSAASAKLAQLQDAHGALAEAVLCQRAASASAAAAAAAGGGSGGGAAPVANGVAHGGGGAS